MCQEKLPTTAYYTASNPQITDTPFNEFNRFNENTKEYMKQKYDRTMTEIENLIKSKKELIKTQQKNTIRIEALEPSYYPTDIILREESEQITEAILTGIMNRIPQHIIIYGPTGNGKTVTVQYILNHITRETKTYGTRYLYINAKETETTYKIYQEILREQKKGQTTQELKERATHHLTPTTILVIDEADRLQDLDIIYHVTRFTKTSLILLTQNSYWYRDLKDQTVKTTLQAKHIIFKPYLPPTIQEILTKRCQEAFRHWEAGIISLLSAKLYTDFQSDIRIGMEALKNIGLTDQWETNKVYEQLQEANEKIEQQVIKNLTNRQIILLDILRKEPITANAYQTYQKKSSMPISRATFLKECKALTDLGLILLINTRVKKTQTFQALITLHDTETIGKEATERGLNLFQN